MTATEQQIATALLAVVNAALPADKKCYELNEVPSPRPADYVEMTLSRTFGGEFRACGGVGVTSYRVTFRGISQTTVKNVRNRLETCRSVLESAQVVVDSDSTTPIRFETEDPVAADDGWFSGLHSYTFAI